MAETPQRVIYQTAIADGMKALGGAYQCLLKSGLGKPLIDLVFLRASQVNGCAYCIDMHAREALAGGASIEKVMLVSAWHEAGSYFSDRERAALTWTESVTNIATTHAPDADYAVVSAQFSEKEIAELTYGIALINTYNRMAIALRRPPESIEREG